MIEIKNKMKKHQLKQIIKEEIKKSLKEGVFDDMDIYQGKGFGDPSNPDYHDVQLYWEEENEIGPDSYTTLTNFVDFLDKHTSRLPDSLLKIIGGTHIDENKLKSKK